MLEFRNVDSFYGSAQILFDVTLTVGRETVVLLGRNGAGKSTTVKSAIGLVRTARGEVVFEGSRVDRLEPFEIARRGLGYVPEERRIFSDLTVRENLDVGRQPARAGAPTWTHARVFDVFPELRALESRRAGRLSGGEQQMVAIGRTLMGNPTCVLLDEPTEGLSPVVIDRMAVAIRELKESGVGVLLAEQNWSFATEVGDRAYIIEKGHICLASTVAELDADEATRNRYLAV
jgi:branched-chain amino acid transport system ATP-binding protein